MKRIAIALILSFPLFLFAQTIISGGNVSGVWNKCNSPYLIQGNPEILGNDTLIIEAGVEVIFYPGYYITINGSLYSNGVEGDSVYFSNFESIITKEPYVGQLYFISEGSVSSNLIFTKIDGVNIETGFTYPFIGFTNSLISNSLIYLYGYLDNFELIDVKVENVEFFSIGYTWQVLRTVFIRSKIDFESYTYDHLYMTDFIIRDALDEAIYTWASFVTLKNGLIQNCWAGLLLESDAGSTGGANLNNVTIEGCYGADALFVNSVGFIMNDCIVKNNINGSVTSWDCTVNISNCVFENNSSTNGGGLAIDQIYPYSNSKIENTIFRNNIAVNKGGGLFLNGLFGGQLRLDNVQFYGNSSQYGGGFYTGHAYSGLTVNDIIVYNNSAIVDGGGIFLDEPTLEITLIRATICNNIAGNIGGGIFINNGTNAPYPYALSNNIMRSNSPDQINCNDTSIFNFEYSNIQNGWPGTGNIDADPLFTDPANGDYSLSWTNFPMADATKSPCIDSGNPASPLDPDGTPADMGAFPFNQAAPYEPQILSITDVPNDQGLSVNVVWKASVTDNPLYNEITHYTLWRELAASKSTWTYLGAVTADYSSEYFFTAPTLADSTSAGIPWFSYKVIAETSDPATYYTCQPDSGYSVDNLPPEAPTGLYGVYNNNKIGLYWNPSAAEDFDHFNIYERDLSTSNPMMFLESTNGYNFGDPWLSFSDVEYTVTAVDVNGNESNPGATWQASVIPGFYMDITVMMEGPFNGSEMDHKLKSSGVIPLAQPYSVSPWNYNGPETVLYIPGIDIVDWVLLELRQAPYVDYATNATIVARQAAFVKADGEVVAIDGLSWPRFDLPPSDDYYLVVWHRNHLGILSSIPITKVEQSMSYDFTTGPEQYYHGLQGAKELAPGIWGMIAADLNGDGTVNDTDKTAGWNIDAGKSGYLFSDANLDAHTNNRDKNQFLYLNASMESQIPDNYQFNCGEPLYDYRDGRSYATVQIGEQCWMAENLNLGEMICGVEDQSDNGIFEKYCYGNLREYCDTFGGLYQWNEMMAYALISESQGICPQGWHVPSDADWCELEDYADAGSIDCEEVGWKGSDAGYRLKSESGWLSNGNGGDDHDFTALPAGYRADADGHFYRITKGSYFWSSDENDSGTAWRTGMEYNFSSVNKGIQQKADGRSLRCIKN